MKNFLVAISMLVSGLAMAAEYNVKDLRISMADFVNNEKVSKDGRCTVKVERWVNSPFSSLYIYDRDDNSYQNSIAFADTEDGTTVIAAEAINEKCSLESDMKSANITCRGIGFRETVEIKVSKDGLIKEINHIDKGAGISGHSIPFPYIKNKKLNCKF